MNDSVLLEVTDGVARITLNRPDQLNAINYAVLTGLLEAVQRADADPEVGCIVVTGAGRGFCAGGDMREGAGPPKDDPAPVFLRDGVEASRLLRESRKPTIAMVNGPVAGAGIGVAGACDLRFASKSATFVCAYDKVGAAGDYGATFVWVRALGAAKAREIFLLGEKFTADEALAFGIYTRVFEEAELRAATLAVAQRLADGPRPAYGYMKENLNAAETELFGPHLDRETGNLRVSAKESYRWLKARREAAQARD